MYISKRGSQFVLVATLLMMLSPLRCATTPVSDELSSRRTATCSKNRLYVSYSGTNQNSLFDSPVTVYRNGKVIAPQREEDNKNNLLLFESDQESLQSESQKEGKLFINIYNKRAQRYICFTQSGKVRTLEQLPQPKKRSNRKLICRFMEQPSPSNETDKQFVTYVADVSHDESRRGAKQQFITFCPSDGKARLCHKPSSRRCAQRGGGKRQRVGGKRQRGGGRRRSGGGGRNSRRGRIRSRGRNSRRRFPRRKSTVASAHHRRHGRPPTEHRRRHSRRSQCQQCQCQHIFMKKQLGLVAC